ncbi:putative mitochondrial protein, partial [Mucuna pruriens]
MISLEYKQSQSEHTQFIKHFINDKLILLLVYVDDMIIAGDDEIKRLTLKEKLATNFEMKELGKMKELNVIFIYQIKYVFDLLKETRKLGCKTTMVPIEQNHKIESEESSHVKKSQYQRLAKYEILLQVVERILCYLKTSLGKGVLFKRGGSLLLEIYTNAYYAGLFIDKRSTSGYYLFLRRNMVTWRSKKQNVVAWSSAKAEF